MECALHSISRSIGKLSAGIPLPAFEFLSNDDDACDDGIWNEKLAQKRILN